MKKIIVCIGAGNIASGYDDPSSPNILTHAHAVITSSFFSLGGFYDVNREKAAQAGEKWGGKVFESIEAACKAADILCIAVPDAYHYEVLKQCAEYDGYKAIICEKPIARTTEEGEQIKNLYKEKGIPIFVNYSRCYSLQFRDVEKWINTEAGELIFGKCTYGKGLTHNASHLISLFGMFFGKLEIDRTGRSYADFFADDPSIDFSLSAGKGILYFNVIPCNYLTDFGFELYFTKGKIRYDGSGEFVEYSCVKESDVYKGEMNYRPVRRVELDMALCLKGLYENIYNHLFGQEKICCDMDDAISALKICEDIHRGSLKK